MIELTYRPHPTNALHHNVTVWVNNNPSITKMMTVHDLKKLRDELSNELTLLNKYIFKAELNE